MQPQPPAGMLSNLAGAVRGAVSSDEASKNLKAEEVARQLRVWSSVDRAMCEVETTQFDFVARFNLADSGALAKSQGRATKRRRVYEASAKHTGCGCKPSGNKCAARCPCRTAQKACGTHTHTHTVRARMRERDHTHQVSTADVGTGYVKINLATRRPMLRSARGPPSQPRRSPPSPRTTPTTRRPPWRLPLSIPWGVASLATGLRPWTPTTSLKVCLPACMPACLKKK
jgi:hypothetical protein